MFYTAFLDNAQSHLSPEYWGIGPPYDMVLSITELPSAGHRHTHVHERRKRIVRTSAFQSHSYGTYDRQQSSELARNGYSPGFRSFAVWFPAVYTWVSNEISFVVSVADSSWNCPNFYRTWQHAVTIVSVYITLGRHNVICSHLAPVVVPLTHLHSYYLLFKSQKNFSSMDLIIPKQKFLQTCFPL